MIRGRLAATDPTLDPNAPARTETGRDEIASSEPATHCETGRFGRTGDRGGRPTSNFKTGALNRSGTSSSTIRKGREISRSRLRPDARAEEQRRGFSSRLARTAARGSPYRSNNRLAGIPRVCRMKTRLHRGSSALQRACPSTPRDVLAGALRFSPTRNFELAASFDYRTRHLRRHMD